MKENKKHATNIIHHSTTYMCYIGGSEKIINKEKGDVNNEKMEVYS
jgi:hypothetical protein